MINDGPHVVIYTDGACSGNPGPGGWGAILTSGSHRKELKGGEDHTTNNRMELMGAISALEALKGPSNVELHTDSKYVQQGISQWIHGWKRNGWRRKDGRQWVPIANEQHWQQLDQLLAKHEVRFTLVRGHAGHPENERCDVLAVAAAAAVRQQSE